MRCRGCGGFCMKPDLAPPRQKRRLLGAQLWSSIITLRESTSTWAGAVSSAKKTEKLYDPHGFHRHLIHRKESDYAGQRVPEEDSFDEQIAEALKPAREIILIGHGTAPSTSWWNT
jgi:hypothetical protein